MSIWHGDVSSVETDMYRPANEMANVRLPHKKVKLPDIPVEDARCTPDESDRRRTHTEALTGHGDVPNVNMYAIKPENEMQIISIPRKREKPPDLPVEAARCIPEESDGLGDRTDMSSARTDIYSAGNETETSEIETKIISHC